MNNIELETWKDVIGYEGLYQISSLGRVKNNKGKILKLKTDTNNYLSIKLSKLNRKKYHSIHRLVAIHFLPNPQNYPCVNHKDEQKQNNCVSNLEWCSYSHNNNYNNLPKRQLQTKIKKMTNYYLSLFSHIKQRVNNI